MSLSSALGEIAWKKEPRTCRADATPAEGAGRCVGTRGSGVAAEGNWLLLGAEVSRNLTQALVAPTGMGHGAWVRARNVQAGRQAEFAIRRPKGLHSTGTANRLGLVWNKVAALNTGTGRNRGFVEAEYVVRKLYAIAGADNALVRRIALWYGELRFGTENCALVRRIASALWYGELRRRWTPSPLLRGCGGRRHRRRKGLLPIGRP